MFDRDQRKISAYAQASPENMARVLKFVILTIRVRLANVPADMSALDEENDAALDGVLYGWKGRAIADIDSLIGEIYPQALRAYHDAETPMDAANDILPLFLQITGLGLVKAGFAAQLIFGVSACLDTHNVRQYGIKACQLRADDWYRWKPTTRARKVARYNELCDKLGGTRTLWDNWCEYVAGQQNNGVNATQVSALHCDALGL